ncbi:hypothetical protein M0812_02411 [Anaeramoeba flamelloides]|uniref:Uncharacterized protein n=1 Tax=Anaeramoeba flamelloides TaxID=1746091 RepID=A0AAV7YML8_9EUKA|nr:hypothetical protein M0812_02411 [Anaeramoeba flamelloides]
MFHRPSSSSNNNNIKRNLINQFLEDKDPKNEKRRSGSKNSENEENKNENVSEKKFESETETEKEKVNDRKKIKNNELIKKFILVDSKKQAKLMYYNF